MMKYKILWIDDNPSTPFCVLANMKGLEIIKSNCYSSGINELNRLIDQIDAVILDVNCLETNNDPKIPSMQAFGNYWKNIDEICTSNGHFIPWFVYTAGDYEGANHLSAMIPLSGRTWDDRKFYNKPNDSAELLDNVIKAIENTPDFKIKKYYSDIFDICPLEYSKPLFEILKRFDANRTDTVLFVEMRKMIESMAEYLRSHGFVWQTEKGENESKLNEAKNFIVEVSKASRGKYVPRYISYGLSTCCDVINKGSHNSPNTESNVCRLVDEGKAPYLLRSTFYEFLTFIHWAFMLPQDQESIAKLQKNIENCLEKYQQIEGHKKVDRLI